MTWRLAKSLERLREQVNVQWPGRSKESDGSIGDEAHASRSSDHNPWVSDGGVGVVTAIDITHDPRAGCDSQALAEVLRASRDPRIKYIISNRRICSSETRPWEWRAYTGSNPHNHHVHISVKPDQELFDDVKPWDLTAAPLPQPSPVAAVAARTLRRGDTGPAVEELQRRLNTKSIIIDVDGVFGQATYAGVKRFQGARRLVADGVVGPQTWALLSR